MKLQANRCQNLILSTSPPKLHYSDASSAAPQDCHELIALDQWTTSAEPFLYGAVATGDVWQFGRLHRQQRRIEQDLNLYRGPADLDELFQILVGILTSE